MHPFKTSSSQWKKPSSGVEKKYSARLKIVLFHASNIEKSMQSPSLELYVLLNGNWKFYKDSSVGIEKNGSMGNDGSVTVFFPVLSNLLVIHLSEIIVTKHITTLN